MHEKSKPMSDLQSNIQTAPESARTLSSLLSLIMIIAGNTRMPLRLSFNSYIFCTVQPDAPYLLIEHHGVLYHLLYSDMC